MMFKFRSDQTEKAFKKIYEFVHAQEDWFVIDIQKAKKIRSLQQNKYYWGVVVKIVSQHTGYTNDEAHQELASMFLKYENNGKLFVRSTTKLNTAEFEKYTEECRQWAWSEMNLHIPLPNEITEEMYMLLNNIFERP